MVRRCSGRPSGGSWLCQRQLNQIPRYILQSSVFTTLLIEQNLPNVEFSEVRKQGVAGELEV